MTAVSETGADRRRRELVTKLSDTELADRAARYAQPTPGLERSLQWGRQRALELVLTEQRRRAVR